MNQNQAAEAFLREANIAILSTLGPGGQPHAAPIWYLYEDGLILMLTGANSQKHRNIERNSKVALTIDRRSLPYYAVMIQGTAELGGAPLEELRLRLAVRYLGEETGRAYIARGSADGSRLISLRPSRIIEYQGTAAR
ncbi:MAG: PPOX class F420-dependent oxidoreductase [Dehalococcoidia bacterium]